MKRCSKCRVFRSRDAFGANRGTKDGLDRYCRECRRIQTRTWHRNNREKIRPYAQAYREANRDKHRASMLAWHKVNREQQQEYHKARYETNPEKYRAYAKAWRDANPEKLRAQAYKYRALKRGAFVADVRIEDVLVRDKGKCGICGKRVDLALRYPNLQSGSLDHIVPLSCGGFHAPENVQLAHLGCNIRKGNRGGGEQLMLCG